MYASGEVRLFMFRFFATIWRFVSPLPSAMTAFGTEFLFAAIATMNREKALFTPQASSFLKGEMHPLSMPMMLFPVVMRANQFKIFNSIICSIAIFVMYVLNFCKWSAQEFCHYISVLKSLYGSSKHWIATSIDKNIPTCMPRFTTLPIVMIGTAINDLRNSVSTLNSISHNHDYRPFSIEIKP